MKRLPILALALTLGGGSSPALMLLASLPLQAQLDTYGGLTSVSCPNSTGHFIVEKTGSQWAYCTPAGHAFISVSIGSTVIGPGPATKDCQGDLPYSAMVTKYGGSALLPWNWSIETVNRARQWNFNSIGQDSVGWVEPGYEFGSSAPARYLPASYAMPFITEMKPAEYAMANYSGDLAGALKDEMNGLGAVYNSWRGSSLPDVFDPKLAQEWSYELNESNASNLRANDPWILSLLTDDADYFWGVGNGPYFETGHTNANIGYLEMIAAPYQTFIKSTPFAGKSFVFSDPVIHTKVDSRGPLSCSLQAPCTLHDFLSLEYGGNIAALDAAWDANYTSFNSTAGSYSWSTEGDGKTATFSTTLKTPVEPESIAISVGGALVAGDCPWYLPNCGKLAVNTGVMGSPTNGYISASSVNYQTGQVSVTFAETPAAGAAVGIMSLYDGWCSGGTGLMDECGNGAWLGTNPFCLEPAIAAYAPYFSCVGGAAPNNPKVNANAKAGADLDAYSSEPLAEYFSVMRSGLNAAGIHVPYFGLDTLGSWNGAPAIGVLQAAGAGALDGIFLGGYRYGTPDVPTSAADYNFVTEYLGDFPIMTFNGLYAQPDSAMSCFPDQGITMYPTQPARGQAWSNQLYYLLSTPGFNGDFPVLGFDWWDWQDIQDLNEGLVSIHDNAYDGVQAVIAAGVDPWGYPTGGEAANYGDSISEIESANAQWQSQIPLHQGAAGGAGLVKK